MEAIKPVSRVSSSQIAVPLSSGKRKIHCRRYMMLSSCERQIGIRKQRLKQYQVPGAVGCVPPDPGLVAELEKELEGEIIEGKLGEKSGGVVELLECLEKEAIMGEDEGRDLPITTEERRSSTRAPKFSRLSRNGDKKKIIIANPESALRL